MYTVLQEEVDKWFDSGDQGDTHQEIEEDMLLLEVT